MKSYRLFAEWREIRVIGENLGAALLREGKLREPARFAEGVKVADGDFRIISKIHPCLEILTNATRGGEPYIRALVEFEDGRISQIDARLEEEFGSLPAGIRAELENKQLRKNAPDTSAPGMGEFHDHFGGS